MWSAARSWRADLQAALAQRPVDGLAQAAAALNEGGLLTGGRPGGELGAGPHRRRAPLHAGVLLAELDDQDRRRAPVALDPPQPGVALVGGHAGHGQPVRRAARFSATSASHSATARLVSTSNSKRAVISGVMSSTSV